MRCANLFAILLNNRARKNANRVLDALAIVPGSTIADVGSGGGFFTFAFAGRTGAAGTVFALDVDPALLTRISRIAKKRALGNVVPVLSEAGVPNLPPQSCDLVFLRSVYHHLPDPPSYFRQLGEKLKPGGRVAVLDWKRSSGGWVARSGHAVSEEKILAALEGAGFSCVRSFDFLPKQCFFLFQKTI
ncbi:MAG TPA: methyltransferase domain-containing protein [Eubacteriales bacterium]|nr:methyltransferase domain-containing protein [Eubacteriales bacterium]